MVSAEVETPTVSKNQLKKLKRDKEWEDNRAKRKARRKEKVQQKKQRKREACKEAKPISSIEPEASKSTGEEHMISESKKRKRPQYEQLPITLVLDCGFDDLMMEKERKSLGCQITRCYSDNQKAHYRAHLAISSFGGHLKERFDGLLTGQYRSWKNIRFLEGDFVEAAAQAATWMKGRHGGKLIGAFADRDSSAQALTGASEDGEVIYLTSDSPDTLTELRPHSTYVIGGLVDRNRHKGICYKRALDRGMKTAKLPIGDYMQMNSRFVLATNHVVEIMLRWLELGDWGKAFLQVVPKRKGGSLKAAIGEHGDGEIGEEADEGVDDRTGDADVEPGEPVESAYNEHATAALEVEAQAVRPGTVAEETAVPSAGADVEVDERDGEADASSDFKVGGDQSQPV